MRLLPAVAASALAALLVVGLAQSRVPDPGGPRLPLRVTGGVRWLYPGVRLRLPLVVWNSRDFGIRVMSLRVSVGDARPGCRGTFVRIGRFRGPLVVPPHGFRTTSLPVTMLSRTPDACERAVFPLTFTAGGRRA